jgi:hypothetical protein
MFVFQARGAPPTTSAGLKKSTGETALSGRVSAAESLKPMEMVMAAYRTLLETDESLRDSL